MRALELDFRRDYRPTRWAGMLILAAGVATAVAAGAEYSRLAEGIASAEAALRASGNVSRSAPAAPRAGSASQPGAPELKHANEVLRQLSLPWNELFASIEAAATKNAALLSFESERENGRIKITGEAKDLEGMLEYVRSLKAQAGLTEVYLQSHEVQREDPQRPVRFVIAANWRVRK